jgi:hypothetical protein
MRIAHAVARQPEGGFEEFLLEESRPEFDDEMRLDVTGVPEAVGSPWWNRELLAWAQLDVLAINAKGGSPGYDEEVGGLDRVDVRDADGAARRHPGFVLDELAVGFRGRFQEPDPLAKERVCNDAAFDFGRVLRDVFGGLLQRPKRFATTFWRPTRKLVELLPVR